jgi:hypothetical protein
MARQFWCGMRSGPDGAGSSVSRALSWILAAVAMAPLGLGAQTLAERCGEVATDAPPQVEGRWLAWSQDGFGGREPRAEYAPILHRLREFAEPFQRASTLDPPPGVEVRPHRVIWGEGPPELGPPFPRSALLIQLFHPTLEQAGEASASIEVMLNTLFPLFYGVAQPIAEDAAGPIFVAPEQVGDLAGAPVFWSGRPRDCLVVFKAHDRPLWTPVSRGRFLEALARDLRHQLAEADSVFREGRVEAESGDADREMQEAIRQLRQIDPEAAAELERQVEAMKREMERRKPALEEEMDDAASALGAGVLDQVAKLEAELASMSPGERASPAYVAGVDASPISLLSSQGAEGARALVEANVAYLDADTPPEEVQLLVVELGSSASHAPEETIIAQLRMDVDWTAFWDWVR